MYANAALAVMRCVCGWVSGRLGVSVCVSVTFVDHVKTNEHIFKYIFIIR